MGSDYALLLYWTGAGTEFMLAGRETCRRMERR